jgi:hypothetical protein
MPTPTPTDGLDGLPGRTLDAVVLAVSIATLFLVPTTLLSFAFGADWYGVKFWLFIVGMLLTGLSLWLLRPDRPWNLDDDEDEEDDDTGPAESIGSGVGKFEATIHGLPPLSWAKVPPGARASSGVRLLLAGLLLFGLSYVMETVFAVCAPSVQC